MNTANIRTFPGAIGILLLSTLLCRAEESRPTPDSSLDIIQYKTPAGWKASDRPGQLFRTLVSPDSNVSQQALILILISPDQGGQDLRISFDKSVKEITGERKAIESSEVFSTKTRQGFDALSQTVIAEATGGARLHVRMIAAKVQNRIAGMYYLATSADLYAQHQPDMDSLLQSVSFTVGAGNPVAAKAEIETLEKQKQELLKKVAEIEARQRQLATAGGAPAGSVKGAPVDTGEALLAQAKERFAKEVSGRRKPHTILGDILCLNGKPIPNVASYEVFVWGTTVAAQTTHYGLEVDANGHFEQQIPDGLYQIKASCIVNHAGRLVPVDLVAIDGKKHGVDQATATGVVKDFRLVMAGLKPEADPKAADAYFGGVLSVNGPAYGVTIGSFSTRHPGAKVQVTLTPRGPLIDGSSLDPLSFDIAVTNLDYSLRLRSLPLGEYDCTTTLAGTDGTKQTLPVSRAFDGDYANSAVVYWECWRDNQEQRHDALIYFKD